MKYTIDHPAADTISVVNDPSIHYADADSSEIAFFKNGEWVIETIPEFAHYGFGPDGDTRVYGWVPNEIIAEFLFLHGSTKATLRKRSAAEQAAMDWEARYS
jgi:hypothetical protein